MKLHALIILAAGLLLAADAPKNDAKKEADKFNGTWKLVSAEFDGEKAPEDVVKASKLVIDGDKHTVNVGKDTYIGTHKVDPTQKPMTIDSTDTEGPSKGQTMLGIYELNGDEFKVCFAMPGSKERPKEFSAKKGSGQLIHVWKKDKP